MKTPKRLLKKSVTVKLYYRFIHFFFFWKSHRHILIRPIAREV